MLDRLITALPAAALLSGLAGHAHAQNAQRASATPARAALVAGVPDSAVLGDLEPRLLGPAVMSGRISDIAVASESNAPAGTRLGRVMYVAAAAGGVWKTMNGGETWTPIFDDQPVASIGDVAVAPSNPDIVWVGSGESNNLRSSSWGNGIYKSTDAGKSWTHMGLRASQHIGRVLVHPANPDIVYVAAVGPLWAAGGERGVFKTTDGGRTWQNIKSIGPSTGFTDLAFDPTNPETVYAVAYQRERRSYSFVAGGPQSGIWKTTDGGATWKELKQGLPTGDKGRIGIDVSRSQPRTLYAVVHAEDGGVFRSDDGGESWTKTSSVSSIPWYFGQIRVDPKNPERVYHLGQGLQRSDDGGKRFTSIGRSTHADHHAMWIDPNDPRHIVLGNDGGLYISRDQGENWQFVDNLPVSTFYAIAVDMREPFYRVYGGLQDNGTWGAPVATRNRTGIINEDWYRAGGGDGFYAAIDPTDPNVVYAESQNGALSRVDALTDERKSIRPPAEGNDGLRYNWSAPLLISPFDHNTLYFGANHLFRSTDRGDTWQRLGGDLTRALDRDRLPIMGLKGPGGLGRHDGTAPYGNIATLDESPMRQGLLYVGTDDGVIAVSRDAGATWTKVEKFPGVPDQTYVSRVSASAQAEGTVYATMDGHRSNDFTPYVLKSTDYGKTWTSITSNLPPDGSTYVIREHPRNANVLFVGTEFGLFTSVNGGGSWSRIRNGLPTVAVHDLIIHPRENDLVIATHGRGIWVIDDIAPLERLAVASQARVAHLFPVRDAMIYNQSGGPGGGSDGRFSGDNPPAGALLSYYVAASQPANGRATLAIVDATGDVVRELPARLTPGVHRARWDLRYASPVAPPPRAAPSGDEEEEEGRQFGGNQPTGPYVFPGQYRVQLRVASGTGEPAVVSEVPVTVEKDPLVRLTVAEYAELHDTRMKALSLQRDAQALTEQLEGAKSRVERALAGADSTSAAGRQAKQLVADLDALLLEVRGPQRGGGRSGFGGGFGGGGGGGGNQAVLQRATSVLNQVGTSHFMPTAEQKTTLTRARADLEGRRAAVSAALARESAATVGLAR